MNLNYDFILLKYVVFWIKLNSSLVRIVDFRKTEFRRLLADLSEILFEEHLQDVLRNCKIPPKLGFLEFINADIYCIKWSKQRFIKPLFI